MKQRTWLTAMMVGCALIGAAAGAHRAVASDHDDGVSDLKTQNTNFSDLYCFTEKSQNPAATGDNMILVMNVNPHSLPRQQYFYNTNARYEFHVSRVGTAANNDDAPAPKDDVILRYEFAAPDANNQQAVTLTTIADGNTQTANSSGAGQILTTPIDATPINNSVAVGNTGFTVFAGLREDPFFFDVEQFFKVRASAAKRAGGDTSQPQVTFNNPGNDSLSGMNVLSLVTRVPRSFLAGSSGATTFDVWETITLKQ